MRGDTTNTFLVRSLHRDYEVTFLQNFSSLQSQLAEVNDAVFVVDGNLQKYYRQELDGLIGDRPVLFLDALESTKSLNGVSTLIDWLLENECNRSAHIIGVGGGIIQDVVAFTSHIYYRGIKYSLVPTTLLSMCDSSIGAKCGINFGSYKNQLGVIHAPASVHINFDFLETLSDLDVKSGYGEILKLSITGGKDTLSQLFNVIGNQTLKSAARSLVPQSLEIKRSIIEDDEYEHDRRRILNYGHTFGHALEAATEHAIPHGLAVAWGIDLVNFLACKLVGLPRVTAESISGFIKQNLSFSLAEFPKSKQLIDIVKRDKKMVGEVLNLVVPTELGNLEILPVKLTSDLEELVETYLGRHNVYDAANK